jgi:hypothetical protein
MLNFQYSLPFLLIKNKVIPVTEKRQFLGKTYRKMFQNSQMFLENLRLLAGLREANTPGKHVYKLYISALHEGSLYVLR